MTEYVYANIYQNIVADYIVLTSVWQDGRMTQAHTDV